LRDLGILVSIRRNEPPKLDGQSTRKSCRDLSKTIGKMFSPFDRFLFSKIRGDYGTIIDSRQFEGPITFAGL